MSNEFRKLSKSQLDAAQPLADAFNILHKHFASEMDVEFIEWILGFIQMNEKVINHVKDAIKEKNNENA